jgi:NTE family protein
MKSPRNEKPASIPSPSRSTAELASSQPSIGLALGSGGAKGIAHIIALEAFDELGLKPSIIAGASIGAIAGACYAAGMNGREIREYLLEGIASPVTVVGDLLSCHVGGLEDLFTMAGNPVLLDAQRVVDKLLPEVVPGKFEQMPIRLLAVATDFYAKAPIVFEAGPLRTALAASMAIPGLFQPVVSKGRVLIDGGITNPLPFDLLTNRADHVVAVDINGAPNEGDRPGGRLPRPLDVLFASVQITAHAVVTEKLARHQPTIMLRPAITRFRILDFFKAKEILRAAEPIRDELKRGLDRVLRRK